MLEEAMMDGPMEDDTPPKRMVLSDQERRVARLVANGYANKEVAIVMDISLHTVKVHVKSIMVKYAARNRTEFALMWHEVDFEQYRPRIRYSDQVVPCRF